MCATPLCTPLCHLFCVSTQSAHIPLEWRIHKIRPIFKAGDKSSVTNYRPISLLSSTSKVLERIIYEKVIDFLEPQFSSSQFGFLKGRSSLQQLLVFLADIWDNLDNKVCTDVIYLDFRKAFDSVPHDKLLMKLWNMGISGDLWMWFRSYLNGRQQVVSINNHLSEPLPVHSGVPQGSILGPLLFLIFINELPTIVQSTKLLLFADDTKCYSASSLNGPALLQADVDHLYQWSISNISFNTSKSAFLRFGPPGHADSPVYFANGQPLPQSTTHRDLGVLMSDDLSWSDHYSFIVSRALRTLGLVRRTVGASASVQVRKCLYLLLIRSQMSYCSQIWRPHLIKDISLLESVQRKATKWILNNFILDYKSRLCSLQLLPLMMSFEVNNITFFITSVKMPTSNFNILQYVSFSSTTTCSCGIRLRHQLSHYNSSRHFYFTRLPRLWDKLSKYVDLLDCSVSLAKSRLCRFMWSYFEDFFCSNDLCTYHFCCPCSKCINSQVK